MFDPPPTFPLSSPFFPKAQLHEKPLLRLRKHSDPWKTGLPSLSPSPYFFLVKRFHVAFLEMHPSSQMPPECPMAQARNPNSSAWGSRPSGCLHPPFPNRSLILSLTLNKITEQWFPSLHLWLKCFHGCSCAHTVF